MANRKLLLIDASDTLGDLRIPPGNRLEALRGDRAGPGEILLEEFLAPLGITQYRLAQTIGVPPRRINEIAHGKRAISPDTALRLSRALGTSDRFWMNLQSRYDLDVQIEAHRDELDQIVLLVA